MAVKPSPLKPPCAGRTGQGQQDKVLQSSQFETERHKKVPLGCLNSQEHPQHIPQCEQLAGEAILSASIQQWLSYNHIILLILAQKIYFMPPSNFWANILLLFSAAYAVGRRRLLEKFCQRSCTKPVTASGRVPREEWTRIICISAATKLFFFSLWIPKYLKKLQAYTETRKHPEIKGSSNGL